MISNVATPFGYHAKTFSCKLIVKNELEESAQNVSSKRCPNTERSYRSVRGPKFSCENYMIGKIFAFEKMS